MRIDHLSPTKIDMFLKCGKAFAYRYGEKLIMPPNGAMTLGRTVGSAVDHNYRQKIETHKDLPAKEVLDVFSDEWDKERPDTLFRSNEKPGDMKDEGVGLTSLYHSTFSPQRIPIAVQHEFNTELEFEDGRVLPMKAIADMLEDVDVWDLKTSRARKTETDLIRSTQMGIYAAARQAETGLMPGIGYELLLRQKKPLAIALWVPGSAVDINRLLRVIARVVQGIEDEQFMPASPMAWWCSEKWCGYWGLCPYGGRK